jgi:lipopolysaccharide heptosyltransferase II
VQKILIIRFSSIGDIVLTTPVVRAIKTQVKDAEVHYLTKASYREILIHNPYIDKVFTIDKSVSEVASFLKKQHYDFIVDLHRNLRSLHTKLLLQRPFKSFKKLNIQKWLVVNLKINILPDVHIVDRYMAAAKPLGVINDGAGLDYFIPEKDEITYDDMPAFLKSAFIGIVIGGKHQTKQYPDEKVRKLCRQLTAPVILLGGPEDRERAENIRDGLPNIVFNGCGAFSLNQTASIIKKASVIVTNDTGLMHIAAALKKPIVSLWGNTIPEFGMTPYLPRKSETITKILEVKGLSCRPCSKIGFNKCPKGHFRCMQQINETEVLEAIRNVKKDC